MTFEEAKQLKPGQRVYWKDPDDGICGRVYHILDLEFRGEVIKLWDFDGSAIECYAEELER